MRTSYSFLKPQTIGCHICFTYGMQFYSSDKNDDFENHHFCQKSKIKFMNFVFVVIIRHLVFVHLWRQRGRVVSVSDPQSGDPGFESRSNHYLDLFVSGSVAPNSNPRPRF